MSDSVFVGIDVSSQTLEVASIIAPQRHIAGSSMGQMTSGLCVISIHLIALSGTPGPAQGEA